MALEFSKSIILSTDKRYFFLEGGEKESDGYERLSALFSDSFLCYTLGTDDDLRYPLIPATLLTFVQLKETTK